MKTKTLAASIASTVALGALALGACKKENKSEPGKAAPAADPAGGTAANPAAKDPAPSPAPAPAPAPADPAPAPTDDSAAAGVTVEGGALELLSAGSPPHYELAYRAPAGTKQKVELTLDTAADVPMMGKMVMPTMIMKADAEVTEVKDGLMTATMTFTGVDARDTKESMPGMADMLKGELAKLKGIRTTMTIDQHGKVHSMKVDGTKGDPMLEQMMQQTQQSLDSMVAQLPKEKVGKGAKWRVKQTVESNGMKMDQVMTYELVAVTDKTATVKSVATMTAPPQEIDQQGMKVKLDKLDGSGTSEMTIDFTKLVPQAKGQIAMKMSMNFMGQAADTAMTMKMDIKAK